MDRPTNPDGLGRSAVSPGEIPERGRWYIARRVYRAMGKKNLSILAAGVAYFAMLSIFPGLAVLVALYGLLADPATVQRQIAEVHGLIPAEAQHIITGYLHSLIRTGSSRLGTSLVISVLFGLWSARAGIVTLIGALNVAYEETEQRGFIRFALVSLLMTLGAILFSIMALTLIAAVPAIVRLLPLGRTLEILAAIAPWPVLVVFVSIGLAITYRFAPSRSQPKWQWVSWGSTAATVLWVAASAGFSIYVRRFGKYNATFGSLGAVVILLTWFYLSAYAVLLGACLNAEIEHQTARDTTTGTEKPTRPRSARSADTVAENSP
jgi:membrane protein